MKNHMIVIVLLCFVSLGCSDSKDQHKANFGKEEVRHRILEHSNPLAINFRNDVQPIIENRCVVCHGCYDSPCQLKLSSPEGIDRGFSPENIYATRFSEIAPTRLFIDAETTQQWRDKDKPFKPVLNERDNTPEANLEGSVFYRMLTQKQAHPLTGDKLLSNEFDISLTRNQTCPSIEEHEDYQKDFPLGGMPYGLPKLANSEFRVLENWLREGAIMSKATPLSSTILARVVKWERLLNGKDNKSQLISRYIYEHLFLGHIYFSEEEVANNELPIYFRLVRSSTPPGQPIKEIATRRPYEDPLYSQVYYRLRREHGTVLTKTHLPYAFNSTRMARWNELFFQNDFVVNTLPGYDKINNAFKVFKELPAKSRYQFMLDEAEFYIMGFIKGPSCRGQTALNLIQDKSWVFFTNPEVMSQGELAEPEHSYESFLNQQVENLELPSDYSVDNLASVSWYKYSQREENYLKAQQNYARSIKNLKALIGFPSIWTGNDNAALTIFRNFDSAVVKKGLHGSIPKTAWLVDYPRLERIHYLLVAGFDIYSPVKHQLVTRLYMDFLRIESEMAIVTFLPKNKRKAVITSWYQDATSELDNYLTSDNLFFEQENSVKYHTNNEFNELMITLKSNQEASLTQENLKNLQLNITDTPFVGLNHLPNKAVQQLSETSFILFEDNDGIGHAFTLFRHDERKNISTLLFEENTRLVELDYAEVFSGFIGSYPQTIFYVGHDQQESFVKQLSLVKNKEDYSQLLDIYGVRRTSPIFWQISDKIHALHKKNDNITYGLFDYNRLENR